MPHHYYHGSLWENASTVGKVGLVLIVLVLIVAPFVAAIIKLLGL